MKEKKGNIIFFPAFQEREKKGKEVSFQNFSLQSTEVGWSEFIGPRTKVHLLDEGYAWIPKTWDFTKDSSEKFEKSKVSGFGSVNGTSYSFFYAPRGRDSSYFGLFYTLRAIWWCYPKGLFGHFFLP